MIVCIVLGYVYVQGVPMLHSHVNIIQSLGLAYLSEPMLDDVENNVMIRDLVFNYVRSSFNYS